MNSSKCYVPWNKLDCNEISFCLGTDRNNKPTIKMVIGANCKDVAMVTPAFVTNWPRVTGDGNFGTMWGPTDVTKAKFSLDLTDAAINGTHNPNFDAFATLLEAMDDKLLDFVHQNQLRILGRKHLSREEVKMLQIRSVRPKYDKQSGALVGHSLQLTTAKYQWDGMGGKHARAITVCDKEGKVIKDGQVCPGDVVAATAYANQVYTGVGGDKFGIHWGFEDVSVVCQRNKLDAKLEVPCFALQNYDYAQDYSAQDYHNVDSPTSIEAMA